MNPLGIIKAASDLVVSLGAGAVVGNAIKASTPANLKLIQRIGIGVGGFVLSSMVGAQAAKFANEQIDGAVEDLQEIKSLFKKND